MLYTNPSIALVHLINRKIDDLHITNGRKSHGVLLMRIRIFSTRQANSIKHAWMTLTCYMLSPVRLSLRLSAHGCIVQNG